MCQDQNDQNQDYLLARIILQQEALDSFAYPDESKINIPLAP